MKVYTLSKKQLLRLQTILEYLKKKVIFFIANGNGGNAFLCIILAEVDNSYSHTNDPLVNLVKEEIIKMIGNRYGAFNRHLSDKTKSIITTEQANVFRLMLVNKWLSQVRRQLSKHKELN
jgi:hypothetical protein